MGLMGMTSFLNKKGVEVTDSRIITAKYVQSARFLADFLAILGTGAVTNFVPPFKIFGIFKMIRILRLGAIISRSILPEETKALLNLAKLVFYLLLILHLLACGWYFACHINALRTDLEGYDVTWIPPLDWLNYKATVVFRPETSAPERYLVFLYHAVLMLGANEMGPVNEAEIIFCVATLIATNIMNANIFGEMAVLVQLIEKKQSSYQEKLDAANTVMAVVKIPHLLQEDIHDYLRSTQETRDN